MVCHNVALFLDPSQTNVDKKWRKQEFGHSEGADGSDACLQKGIVSQGNNLHQTVYWRLSSSENISRGMFKCQTVVVSMKI